MFIYIYICINGSWLTFSKSHHVVGLLARLTGSHAVGRDHTKTVHRERIESDNLITRLVVRRDDAIFHVPVTVLTDPEKKEKMVNQSWFQNRQTFRRIFKSTSPTVILNRTPRGRAQLVRLLQTLETSTVPPGTRCRVAQLSPGTRGKLLKCPKTEKLLVRSLPPQETN